MTGKGSARLRDVAEVAGVDVSTVSRVLSEGSNLSIRPETRKRILDAAAQLNYRPNAYARGLKLARTMTLGMVVPQVANPVYFEIIRGAEHRASQGGYVLLLADADEFGPAADAYRRLLLEGRVDGLLITSATTNEDLLLDLIAHPLPFVLVNRRVEGIGRSIIEDDEAGAALMVEHLASLGHRQIAHIAGPQDSDTGRRRVTGFLDAMGSAELPVLPGYIVGDSFDEQGGFEAMQSLLQMDPRPTGVTVASLGSAIGALSAAKQAGLSVPGDLSIIGFADAKIADYLDPPLAMVRMPLFELGALGVESLLRLIGGEAIPSQQMVPIPPTLVPRGSTGAPPEGQGPNRV